MQSKRVQKELRAHQARKLEEERRRCLVSSLNIRASIEMDSATLEEAVAGEIGENNIICVDGRTALVRKVANAPTPLIKVAGETYAVVQVVEVDGGYKNAFGAEVYAIPQER